MRQEYPLRNAKSPPALLMMFQGVETTQNRDINKVPYRALVSIITFSFHPRRSHPENVDIFRCNTRDIIREWICPCGDLIADGGEHERK